MPLPSIECPQVQWENGQSTLREGRSGDPTDKIADFCNKIGTFRTPRDVRPESAKQAKTDIDRGRCHNLPFYDYTP
jgi:hypothetical protein